MHDRSQEGHPFPSLRQGRGRLAHANMLRPTPFPASSSVGRRTLVFPRMLCTHREHIYPDASEIDANRYARYELFLELQFRVLCDSIYELMQTSNKGAYREYLDSMP